MSIRKIKKIFSLLFSAIIIAVAFCSCEATPESSNDAAFGTYVEYGYQQLCKSFRENGRADPQIMKSGKPDRFTPMRYVNDFEGDTEHNEVISLLDVFPEHEYYVCTKDGIIYQMSVIYDIDYNRYNAYSSEIPKERKATIWGYNPTTNECYNVIHYDF
ncbi:MAG: hypothetical protein IJ890_05870 [Clostridia bacterium]|nr:hypothetical protein [Clostridia bacterium]